MNYADIDIKQILIKLLTRQPIQLQECIFLIEQYIFDLKKVEVSIGLYSPMEMEQLDYAVQFASSYFKNKFGAVTLANKQQQIINVRFAN